MFLRGCSLTKIASFSSSWERTGRSLNHEIAVVAADRAETPSAGGRALLPRMGRPRRTHCTAAGFFLG